MDNKKEEKLEDLVGLFTQQVQSTNWLDTNTPEKWISENPELWKEIQKEKERVEAAKQQRKNDEK